MKATVNENCIGCGLCAGTCPVVFTMGNDGLAHRETAVKRYGVLRSTEKLPGQLRPCRSSHGDRAACPTGSR